MSSLHGCPLTMSDDVHVATLELPRRGVDQPVLLPLPVERLCIKEDDAHLAGFEVAPLLHRGDQLLVVHMAVAEVPADGSAAEPLTFGDHIVVLVAAGQRVVHQRQ